MLVAAVHARRHARALRRLQQAAQLSAAMDKIKAQSAHTKAQIEALERRIEDGVRRGKKDGES